MKLSRRKAHPANRKPLAVFAHIKQMPNLKHILYFRWIEWSWKKNQKTNVDNWKKYRENFAIGYWWCWLRRVQNVHFVLSSPIFIWKTIQNLPNVAKLPKKKQKRIKEDDKFIFKKNGNTTQQTNCNTLNHFHLIPSNWFEREKKTNRSFDLNSFVLI